MNPKFMEMALKLVDETMDENRGGPFGAIIVKDDQVIGQGVNCVVAEKDPTMHAEMMAIREACHHMDSFDLSDCEIYVTCEPCPMCLGGIYWARLRNIYYANTQLDAASIGFDDAFFYQELKKPKSKRAIPMQQCQHEAAKQLFERWNAKEDKVFY